MEITKKLKTTNFKNNVMSECMELFYDPEFSNKLDTKINLIGFNKLQPVFDEYGTVINLNPEKVGGASQKKQGIKVKNQ